ncbi:hypothetical protein FRC18_009970 [Serendipita sp. 400]|nr:hypothetical protein FRC18_009970 [Serendipita sp. 400]
MKGIASLAAVLALSLQTARAVVPIYGQCNGWNWTGDTTCASGTVCVYWNPYYSQCLPPTTTSSTTSRATSSSTSTVRSSSSTRTSSSTSSTITSSSSSRVSTSSASPSSSSTTRTTTYTGTLPIGTLSPTGLAAAGIKKGRYIGSAYDNVHIANTTYTQLVLSQVNSLTPENSMKWDSLEQTQGNFDTSLWADRVVNITQLNNMYLRGHTLVWHSQLPSWVTSGGFNNASLISVMQNHITNVMAKWKGKVYIWDVCNEVLADDGSMRSSVFYNTIGEYFIDIAFNTAKVADPNAILAINDYNIDGTGSKSTGMTNLVTRVKARGVPIEQIGIQAHLIVGQVPTTLTTNWNAFANLGVSIAITELDIRMPTPATSANLAQQATDYTNVINACLSISKCMGITFWGLRFVKLASSNTGY